MAAYDVQNLINLACGHTLVNLIMKLAVFNYSWSLLSFLLLLCCLFAKNASCTCRDEEILESIFREENTVSQGNGIREEFRILLKNILGLPLFAIRQRLAANIKLSNSSLFTNGWRLLHEAVSSDNLPLARLLLEEFRMDPNTWNDYSGNCVYAVTSMEMVKLLQEFGADFTINRGCVLYEGPAHSARARNNFAFFTHQNDFALRVENLYAELRGIESKESNGIGFKCTRTGMYDSALQTFTNFFGSILNSPPTANIHVTYIKEKGIDEGGLTVEFIVSNFEKAVMDPKRKIFKYDDNGRLEFHPTAPEAEVRFIGYLVGLSIYHRVPLGGFQLAPIFYHLLCAHNIERDINFVSVLRATSENATKSLENIKSLPTEDLSGYYYETLAADQGRPWKRVRNEITGRADVANFVRTYAKTNVYLSKEPQFRAFLFGVSRAIDYRVIRPHLQPEELRRIIVGESDFTADNLRHNCSTIVTEDTTHLHEWLYEIIDEFTPLQRKRLLIFFTALHVLPLGGFGALDVPANVVILPGVVTQEKLDKILPEASTCFNRLKLYNYSSKSVMKTNLIMAIENCGGFFME